MKCQFELRTEVLKWEFEFRTEVLKCEVELRLRPGQNRSFEM